MRILFGVVTAAFVVLAGVVPAAAESPALAGQGGQAVVRSVQHNVDGTVTERVYTPAPGVSPDELAKRLTASGTKGVSVGDVSVSVAACSYGTARTWPTSATCFARWSYNGYGRPQMYFRDRSNDLWPVGRAVTKWNETSGIDSYYRDFSTGCPNSTVHCVIVYNAYYGATGWVGQTVRTLNAAQTYYASAYIALNETYGGTQAQRWNTACHEIGHVLGLDHNVSTSSCLYYSRTSQLYPNGDDFTLLERYY